MHRFWNKYNTAQNLIYLDLFNYALILFRDIVIAKLFLLPIEGKDATSFEWLSWISVGSILLNLLYKVKFEVGMREPYSINETSY